VSLTYDEIAEIIKLIDSSSCDELVIETGDMKLVVRRNGAPAAAAAEYTERGSAPVKVAPISARGTPAAASKVEAAAGQVEITAPMVGTFYRAPNPEAPPFVEVGSVVRIGQPLCLIEVMKLFTTINSEVSGRIIQIGAENAELVEYGRALFVIEPA
jgi:acetyl-CoA carboxylase biotin carboxyl carrier protein